MRIKLLFHPPPLSKVEECNVVDVISVELLGEQGGPRCPSGDSFHCLS